MSLSLNNLRARLVGQPLFLSYQDAEAYSQQLAGQLLAQFDRKQLAEFDYYAMPRGGFLVLGLLAYSLNLPRQALMTATRAYRKTAVIVDDCALSGARFKQFLATLPPHDTLIFAHLASPEPLRQAILAAEPTLLACLAPLNLQDLAPQQYPTPEAYQAWQKRWQERYQQRYYWLGLPQLIIFPWNEPDRPNWNAQTNQTENDWRLASPSICLKNWGQIATPLATPPPPQYQIPPHIAYSLQGNDVVWLYHHHHETIYELEGVSTLMWQALATYGAIEVAVTTVQAYYDVPTASLRQDIVDFADSLVQQGLLTALITD